jgi:natural product biosynthesis luciferase-like monooxygenase protein
MSGRIEPDVNTIALPGAGAARYRSVLIGTETLLVECAAILRDHGHEIIAVVADHGPARDWAMREGVRQVARPGAMAGLDLGPIDWLFSITNLAILPQWLVELPRLGAINFHDGPIERYAGLNTPAWALLAGEASHGVTWHHMIEAVDAGDVLAGAEFPIEAQESALSLNTKCFEAGIRTFAELVPQLGARTASAVPQSIQGRRWCGPGDRPAVAATIDWHQPAEVIARMVRALDFGSHRNALGCAKFWTGERLLLVQGAEVAGSTSALPPGTVIEGGEAPLIATRTGDLRLTRLTSLAGTPAALTLRPGEPLPSLDTETARLVSALDEGAARHESWWATRLAQERLQLPHFRTLPAHGSGARQTIDQSLAIPVKVDLLRAAIVGYFARIADRGDIAIGYCDPVFQLRFHGAEPWFAKQWPLCVKVAWDAPLKSLAAEIACQVREMHRHVGIAADLPIRRPELRGIQLAHPVAIQIVDHPEQARFDPETVLGVALSVDGRSLRWTFDPQQLTESDCADLRRGFEVMLASIDTGADLSIARLPVIDESECAAIRLVATGPQVQVAPVAGVHQLIAEQARRTPERVAVTSRGQSICYGQLEERSNQLARHLMGLGVGPDRLVGLHVERSVELVVAMLAIHKAGGAYVPLDPAYPAGRLAHMIADSGLQLIVSQQAIADQLPAGSAGIVRIDADWQVIVRQPGGAFEGGATAENLAYVIYTSGSTGLPKGVMIEHRNLLNFFAGMDRELEDEGVWLAVTSPSFDISVLELCWPLTRGYQVVVATEREVRGEVGPTAAQRPVDFSLFYFASANSTSNAEQYRLLLEGAQFADRHGFEAVWTPERHFHAFGGLYPNPSVISAALAVTTSRVKLRGGSVVAPLHHPARIAEEWSLVDNLSGGRVGIAFASGWQPDDFLLRPESFADKTAALNKTIEDVRALWRGEKRSFPGPLGKNVSVGVFPRPVQAELPFWITSAGNPETFAAAGRMGANVLTHLLGQSVKEVAEKVAAYRAARREAGHPGEGRVTLMLHTFVGEDVDAVREIVRGPLMDYLRTATSLLKQYAWSFPAFRRPGGDAPDSQPDLDGLSEEEGEALLEHAFDRYFETSGLLGASDKCVALIEQLRAVGVDEIGCLIDFGVETQAVLDQLPQLDRLRQLATGRSRQTVDEVGLAELIVRHGVTHLQCTPSLAQMLVDDPEARKALPGLTRMMVGGEAFPQLLAQDLTALVGGQVMNMYGPTETTIWSAVHGLSASDPGAPPLGRPLANQQIHVVDSRMEPVRPGTPGELLIGGLGVVRGYLGRAELTAERFIADPFAGEGRRAYRTGDLVQRSADGRLEFLGRLDHQVKIRGYRIELGEIETALLRQAHVREAVVIARAIDGIVRLIAYCVTSAAVRSADPLRAQLRETLPDYMVPAHVIMLDALPRTPNGKIDRKALPDPALADEEVESEADGAIAIDNPLQRQILDLWRDLLKRERVGLRDNFFDLGGHSLLAVQAHRKLSGLVAFPISLTDIFRFPTIETLSAHLEKGAATAPADTAGKDRARARRLALQRRAAPVQVSVGN